MTLEERLQEIQNIIGIKRNANPTYIVYALSQIQANLATYKTIAADTGSATASTSTDTFTIAGGTDVSTAIVGDTLTISLAASITGALEYKGTVDLSGGAYPTPTGLEKGWYYVVSVAGTVATTYHYVGDLIIYNGTSWDHISGGSNIDDTAYNATSWNNNLEAATKNAIRDKIEILALDTLPASPSGAVGFNSQNITSVGTVDGVDVSAIAITNMPTAGTGWRVHYNNASGVMTELALGASGTYLKSQGAASAPVWGAISSGWAAVVSDVADLQTALDAGGLILLKAGTYNLTATLDIDQNKSVILLGEGDETIIDCNGNRKAFNITAADNVVLSNFMIDANDLTGVMEIIDVTEGSNNHVLIDNISITGDGTNGYGVEINSNNVTIRDCHIDNVDGGIVIKANYATVYGNIVNTCAAYGISLSSANYCSINGNISHSNVTCGIFLITANNNIITENICYNNNLNDGGDGGGIILQANASDNIITENECYGSVNIGAGDGYGISVVSATCDNNIIKNNRLQGNDIAADDVGGNNRWEFDAFSRAEIEDITTNFSGSCVINLPNGTIDLAGNTIDISGGGSYIIRGQGDNTIMDIGGDVNGFEISSATSALLRDFKIDASDCGNGREAIRINEGSDNKIIVDTVTIINDNSTVTVTGIELVSDNCIVRNCYIYQLNAGIKISGGNHNIISANILNACQYGIDGESGQYNNIQNNICYANTQIGIAFYGCDNCTISNNNCCGNNLNFASSGGGIWIDTDSDNNNINGNICNGNANAGAGTGYGIMINNANCDENTVMGNTCLNNDTNYTDSGTNTFDTDGAAQALNNIA